MELKALPMTALTASGVELPGPSIVSAFQCIDQQIFNDVDTTSIAAYAYALIV